MSDRALIRAGMAGAAARRRAVSLPLAGLVGAWLAGAGLVAWAIHRRRPKAADRET
jgi:hypothetical protein